MVAPIDEASLEWAGLRSTDLEELARLVEVIEYLDDTIERHDLDDLRSAYERPGAQPERNALVGREHGGSIVAYCWNLVRPDDVDPRRVLLRGGVHPAFRDQRIGTALLEWQIARALEWDAETRRDGHGPLKLIASVDEKLQGSRELYEAAGLHAETWFYDLHHDFTPGEDESVPPLPDGFVLVPYTQVDSDAVRCAHNEAFATREDARPVDGEAWLASLRRAEARPDLSWVVLAPDGSVAGYALNSVVAQGEEREGWTDRLGVVPAHRHRGLAAALLAASNRGFVGAGCQGSGLGFDTTVRPGAPGVAFFARGYDAEVIVAHALTVRP